MPLFSDIDPNKLDEEWIHHPKMYHKWAKKSANAKKAVADAKALLDVTEAECAKFIRKNPTKYGVTKATDSAVKSAIVLHPAYRKAIAAYNEAKHEQDVIDAAVKALDHRKAALQDLVFLWGQSYFAGMMKPRKNTDNNIRDRLTEASVKASVTRKRKK